MVLIYKWHMAVACCADGLDEPRVVLVMESMFLLLLLVNTEIVDVLLPHEVAAVAALRPSGAPLFAQVPQPSVH
jgi:hypothetical protein